MYPDLHISDTVGIFEITEFMAVRISYDQTVRFRVRQQAQIVHHSHGRKNPSDGLQNVNVRHPGVVNTVCVVQDNMTVKRQASQTIARH